MDYKFSDPDGNLVQSVDARGAAGTIVAGYDGLDRPIWRNTTNSPTGAYDTYGYDSTANGDVGVGRLTSETFSAGSLSGSYAYIYDGRGQQTASTLTVGGSSYPLQSSYDDAGNVLTRTYPDGETVTNTYTGQGWLSGVSTQQGSTTTQLLTNAAYAGVGGGFGELTGASLGGGTYQYGASYDLLDRATDLNVTRSSGGATLFEQARTFDGAGNVSTASTTLATGTDNQAFCYDEQDRLTWAGSQGTPPCTGSPITAGTLSGAAYTQSYSYDVLGRLTSGPQGTYTYGDPAHVHAATAIGSVYTAGYDAAGNMTCRAPTSASTCAGTQTGAQLGYNNEGELVSWQSAPTSPSATASFLYDGQGQRIVQQTVQSGSTTTTVYVGDLEEAATSGSTTTTTAYYYAGGKRIGLSVNGTISYLAADALGSATETLNGSGSAVASELFGPYGSVRYQSGTMPTSYGFTGQRADAVSGLDYYGARYYDPVAGQFASADSVVPGGGFDLWGLSRYAYVAGNPINRTDPSGHCFCDGPNPDGSSSGDNFFPRPGGGLLDANTGQFFSGPDYSQVTQVYTPPSRQESQPSAPKPPDVPRNPCQMMPWLCLNTQPAPQPAAQPTSQISLIGCGPEQPCLSWGIGGGSGRGEGTGSGSFKGVLRGLLAALGLGGGGGTCETDPQECQDLVSWSAENAPVGQHVLEQMAKRGITQRMIDLAVQRGTQYWDAKNQSINYVLQNGGRPLIVGQNIVTKLITTTYFTNRFNPSTLFEGVRRWTPM